MVEDRKYNTMMIVSVNTDRCLQFNYKKADCNRCQVSCPHGCWEAAGRVNGANCDGCGLCVAACPVDAIGVEAISAHAWAEAVDSPSVALACKAKNNGSWGCLGFLTAADLFALAWHGEPNGRTVVLFDGICEGCRPAVWEKITVASQQASELIDAVGRGKLVHAKESMSACEEREKLARRAFFGALFKAGADAVRNVVWPDEGAASIDKSHWRARIFVGKSDFSTEINQSIFPSIHIGSSCIACGLCTKICPFGALQGEDRVTFLELHFFPVACTDCGLCAAHCPESSIQLQKIGLLTDYIVHQQDFPRCNECGQVFQPAGAQLTCFECLMKGRRSIFEP